MSNFLINNSSIMLILYGIVIFIIFYFVISKKKISSLPENKSKRVGIISLLIMVAFAMNLKVLPYNENSAIIKMEEIDFILFLSVISGFVIMFLLFRLYVYSITKRFIPMFKDLTNTPDIPDMKALKIIAIYGIWMFLPSLVGIIFVSLVTNVDPCILTVFLWPILSVVFGMIVLYWSIDFIENAMEYFRKIFK